MNFWKIVFLLVLVSCRTSARLANGTTKPEGDRIGTGQPITGTDGSSHPATGGSDGAPGSKGGEVTVEEGGISGGGQVRPCFFNEPFEFVGVRYEGPGLSIEFLSDGKAIGKEGEATVEYRYEATRYSCLIELYSLAQPSVKRTFLISMDYQSLQDWENKSIQLKAVK